MLTSLFLTAALWPLSATQECTPQENTIMFGVAKNKSGKLLYCELVGQPTPTSLQVSYTRENQVFAEKVLSYAEKPEMPSVIQQDFRFGELRKAEVFSQEVRLAYQANQHKKVDTVSIPSSKVDVIDAGFNNYIRNHWDELQTGSPLSVNFASIAHLKTLPLRISAQPSEQCSYPHREIKTSFCFLVEIDNAFLRLLLGKIKLTYDEQRRLISFNGVVNIVDDKESTQTATINYYYKQDYLNQ